MQKVEKAATELKKNNFVRQWTTFDFLTIDIPFGSP